MIYKSELFPHWLDEGVLDKGEHLVQLYYLMNAKKMKIISKDFSYQDEAYTHFEEMKESCHLIKFTCKIRDKFPETSMLDFIHPLEMRTMISKSYDEEGTITKDFFDDEEKRSYELWRQNHLLQ
jgi:hypothetical protein